MQHLESLEKVMVSIEQGAGPENWVISRETGQWLEDFLVPLGVSRILEIGGSIGYSALWFARIALQSSEGAFVCSVESHAERRSTARDHFDKAGVSEVVEICEDHAPLVFLEGRFPHSLEGFDVIFLDCIKHYYLPCFEVFCGVMKKGSILIADNILSHPEPVQDFIAAVKADDRFEVSIRDVGTGLLVARRL